MGRVLAEGDSITERRRYGEAKLIVTASPIWAAGNIEGAVLVKQSANKLLSLQYRTLQRFTVLFLGVFIFLAVAILVFATRLTYRVGKLQRETEQAATSEGRLLKDRIRAGSRSSDELGSLTRSISALLQNLGHLVIDDFLDEYTESIERGLHDGGDLLAAERTVLGQTHAQIGARLAQENELTLIKPFDNEAVIAGQGTVGLEIANQARDEGIRDAQVLVPCGGGGLTAGIALALDHDAPDLQVRPVEPEGFDDVTRSLETGEIKQNAQLTGSICDAIITAAPGELTFPIMQRLCGTGIVVPDEDCLRAMAQAFTRLKLVIEPGAAIALAAALFHPNQIKGDAVIVVATGGNVDAPVFTDALNRFA